ncbi:general secretion pathway protein GspK [Rhodanobacter glycinis]|uniref:General secretion pathway protein GspK n=1 Tax=Rhodanobacter glycinis TaxID=582702 RepID=A0A5B9E2B0_9GAMM|nr:type II secretion system protein GspK [Rhodanobacter glycinis]QEE26078.1 general secretion pathway protein GspK [Rhodanobacter glycinis]
MKRHVPARSQHGVALLVVLWACTLLAILLGGYAAMARTEGLQARYQFEQTRAHYAAEAGLMRAVYALQAPDMANRWTADGRSYPFRFDGASVSVSATDEGGKVDLNTAKPEVLVGLFRAAGENDSQAAALAKAVVEWRSFAISNEQKAQRKAAYVAAGRSYGPRNGAFASVQEVQMVLGMTPALYARVSPVLTIWSGRPSPDPATAPPLALAALGMTPDAVRAALAKRAAADAHASGLAGGGGVTHSIRSVAVLADGTRAVLRATVRSQVAQPGSSGFAVLRWQEGNGE